MSTVTTAVDVERDPEIADLRWASARLRIGQSTARNLAATGQLPGAFKVGGSWRVNVPVMLEGLGLR